MDLKAWKDAYDKGRGIIEVVIDRNENGTVGAELALKIMGLDDDGKPVQRDGERYRLEDLREQEEAHRIQVATRQFAQRLGAPMLAQALEDEQARLRAELVAAQAEQLGKLDEAARQDAESNRAMVEAWLASLAEREAADE